MLRKTRRRIFSKVEKRCGVKISKAKRRCGVEITNAQED